jgi:hypothetical protein
MKDSTKARILAAVIGTAAVLAGCQNPQQGDPGINGLIPLDLDGLRIFLKDETGRLDPAATAVMFQNALSSIAGAGSNAALITELKTKGSLAIIIENAPSYGSKDFRIINKDACAMRYDYVVSNPNSSDFVLAVLGALTEIKNARAVAMVPNGGALRLAVAPQERASMPAASVPFAELGKRKNNWAYPVTRPVLC